MTAAPHDVTAPVVAHPPKQETFDLRDATNTDPKGFVRPVDVFRETEHGLYMARGADHPRFDYVESWLLPGMNLRITDFHFTLGNEARHEFYVDVALINQPQDAAEQWRTTDLYLDVVCRTGEFTDVLDADELAAAITENHLDAATAALAMDTAFSAATGIAAHGHSLSGWMQSRGIALQWIRK